MDRQIRNKEFIKLVLDRMKFVYHEPSRSYVYFCLDIGKVGIRSIDAFQDTAFESFYEKLKLTVERAKEDQLTRWEKKLCQ